MQTLDPLFNNRNQTLQYAQDSSKVSLSPFERSIANYKATKQQLIDGEFKRITERKQELLKMKKEREMRNSGIINFLSSQGANLSNLGHTQITDMNGQNSIVQNEESKLQKSPEYLNPGIKDVDDSKPLVSLTYNL